MKRLLLACSLLAAFVLGGLRTTPSVAIPGWQWFEPPLGATYTPTPIKSITQVSVSVAAATSNTASWSGTAANAILIFQGNDTNDASGFAGSEDDARGTITSGSVITVTRGATAGTTVWNGVVVEFLSQFVKSQHCGTVSIGDGSTSGTDASFGTVVTSKTLVAYTGQSNVYSTGSGSVLQNQLRSKVTLTNTTTITASRTATSPSSVGLVAGYCDLEFK